MSTWSEGVLTSAEQDRIAEWVFDMCEEYDLPLTNNTPRFQDGVQLRHVGEFASDLYDLIAGIMSQRQGEPERRRDVAEADELRKQVRG